MKDEQLYYFEKSPVFKAMMHFLIANDDRDFIKRYLWHIKYLLYRIFRR